MIRYEVRYSFYFYGSGSQIIKESFPSYGDGLAFINKLRDYKNAIEKNRNLEPSQQDEFHNSNEYKNVEKFYRDNGHFDEGVINDIHGLYEIKETKLDV